MYLLKILLARFRFHIIHSCTLLSSSRQRSNLTSRYPYDHRSFATSFDTQRVRLEIFLVRQVQRVYRFEAQGMQCPTDMSSKYYKLFTNEIDHALRGDMIV